MKLRPSCSQTLYKKTNKLFFKKYVYKVAVDTPLAPYFRSKDLDWVNLKINNDLSSINHSDDKVITIRYFWRNSYAGIKELTAGKMLVSLLREFDDYCLRIESETLGIYFNDHSYLDNILKNEKISIFEVSQPKDEKTKAFLLANPKSIIRKEYTHKYKVTVNSLKKEEENFRAWAEKIPKIKLSSRDFRVEGHFYVADQKTLDLCRLYLNDRIRKIEEIVTTDEF